MPRIFPSGLVAYVESLAQGQEMLNKMLAISSNRTHASLVHSTQLNSVPLPQRDLSGPDDSWQCCLPSTSLRPLPGILLRLPVRGQLRLRAQRLPAVTSACPRPACGLVLIGLAAAHSLSSSCCYYEQPRHGSPRSLLGEAVPGCWLRSLPALPVVTGLAFCLRWSDPGPTRCFAGDQGLTEQLRCQGWAQFKRLREAEALSAGQSPLATGCWTHGDGGGGSAHSTVEAQGCH